MKDSYTNKFYSYFQLLSNVMYMGLTNFLIMFALLISLLVDYILRDFIKNLTKSEFRLSLGSRVSSHVRKHAQIWNGSAEFHH